MTAKFAGRILMSSAFVLGLAGAAHAGDAAHVHMGHSREIHGVRVACAGVGERSQDNPRWNDYAVKLDFVGDYGQYLGNEHVRVRDDEGRLLNVRCHAPWVLMDLQPGAYHATARLPSGAVKHIEFTVPENGQRRVVLRFSEKDRGNPAMTNARYRENGGPYNSMGHSQWQRGNQNEGRYDNTRYNGSDNTGYNANDNGDRNWTPGNADNNNNSMSTGNGWTSNDNGTSPQ